VIRYALTSVQERLSDAELREAVIKHVHNQAKLYPGRAGRGLRPASGASSRGGRLAVNVAVNEKPARS